jgi:hypothetical protein
MALWLFASEGMGPIREARSVQADAVRWLVLSEWLCECAGAAGQSAWNAIYLMRIARGHCAGGELPSIADFRSRQPIGPAEMARCAAGPIALLDAPDWMQVAERLLARQHEQRYGLLQRCGLRLEHAWYAAHAGAAVAAHTSLERLIDEMLQLPTADIAFFQVELRRLPADVTAGLKAQQ